jgi:hypothetical protein
MKKIALVLLMISVSSMAQNKYLTKTGVISFEASVPSFEEVAAKNNSVTAILNADTGEFAALVLVKGFRFKNALMEEHFNENYAESDEFPKATFKGKITDFDFDNLDEMEATINIKGDLTFHGETQNFSDISGTITKDKNGITLNGNFSAKASEFKIDIPNIVKKKVKDEVSVDFNLALEKQ